MHDEVRSDVLATIAATTGVEATVPDDTPLTAGGLGLESLYLLQLATHLERRYGVPFPIDLGPLPGFTLGELVDHVVRHSAGRAEQGGRS